MNIPKEAGFRIYTTLIMADRLLKLDDTDAISHLKLVPEVNCVTQGLLRQIKGRAGWVLVYHDGTQRAQPDGPRLDNVLVVIKAKKPGSHTGAVPQLAVYLAAVWDAHIDRKSANATATQPRPFDDHNSPDIWLSANQ